MPGIPCFIGVLSLFWSLFSLFRRVITCFGGLFLLSSPLYMSLSEHKPQERREREGFTVLIRERGVVTFWVSLCSSAFCSGFVGRLASVSLGRRVYSQGDIPCCITVHSHIPGLMFRAVFVRPENQELTTL